jgi:hypothetical protein
MGGLSDQQIVRTSRLVGYAFYMKYFGVQHLIRADWYASASRQFSALESRLGK